jgi:opacity protein-like surface antigen
MKTLLAVSLLALACASSVAAAADDSWFVDGNVGSSRLNTNDFGSFGSGTAGGVSGGYYFTPNVGIEGRYIDYGKHDVSFLGGGNVRVDGWGIGMVGKWDFGPNNTGFYVDARGGFLRTNSKVSAGLQGGAGNVHLTDNHSSGYIGAGAGWDFNRNFGIGLNYEYAGARAFGVHGQTSTVTGDVELRF